MQKRGQVTIFIILGIVILSIVGFLVFQSDLLYDRELSDEEAEHFVDVQLEPIKTSIENCVSANLVKAIHFVSIQGGYFDPVYYETFGGYNVSYACKEGVNYLPTFVFIKNEILQFMESDISELDNCIETAFDSFNELDLKLSYSINDLVLGEVSGTNIFTQTINFPIEVKKKGYDFVANIDELVISVNSNLKDVYDVAVDIANAKCVTGEFVIDDYIWENSQALDIFSAYVTNGEDQYGYFPWYLTSYENEEDGSSLKFHFCTD
jgi:hypothetical protein